MATILLVEDNPHILKINADEFTEHGHTVLCAECLEKASELLMLQDVDLMILDVMLPDGNGVEFCRNQLAYLSIPVIFLSALGENADIIEGLKAGGEDYLTKPYDLDILVARADVQLRRKKDLRRWENYEGLGLDTIAMAGFQDGEDLRLTRREFGVLLALVKKKGQYISREELYSAAWGQPMQEDSQALRTTISRLKQKLDPVKTHLTISYVRGSGYNLDHF